ESATTYASSKLNRVGRRAARYDSGLSAHRCTRPARKRPAPHRIAHERIACSRSRCGNFTLPCKFFLLPPVNSCQHPSYLPLATPAPPLPHNHARYDAENRLVQVDGTLGTCSTATACYLYDALGHRTVKQTGSFYLSYLHDLSGNAVMEYCCPCSWGTGWNRGHIYFNGQQIAEYESSTTVFHHNDHLGSVRLLTGIEQSQISNGGF